MAARGIGQAEIKIVQQMLGLATPTKPNPAFENVVFVSVDCEAFEFAPKKITEIGFSVLDTRDAQSSGRINDKDYWLSAMRYGHIRIEEHKHLINRRFVKGCPDGFNFGTTKFVHLADVGKVLRRLFNDPAQLETVCDSAVEIEGKMPNVVLVGHDLSNDSAYLRGLGFSPTNVSRCIDTQRLSRPSKKVQPGLKRLLSVLEVPATNLHNAGNDAAYTLQALVLIALKEFQEPGYVSQAVLNSVERANSAIGQDNSSNGSGEPVILSKRAERRIRWREERLQRRLEQISAGSAAEGKP